MSAKRKHKKNINDSTQLKSTSSANSLEKKIKGKLKHARNLFDDNELARSKDVCHEVLELDNNNFEALELIGIISIDQFRYKSAEEYLGKALKLNKNSANLYNNYALAKRNQDKVVESITYYKKAIELNSNSSSFHRNIASAYRNIGKVKEALEHYKAAVKINPRNYGTYHYMVKCQKFENSNNEITEAIINGLNDEDISNDQRIHLHFALAKIYEDCQEYDKAFDNYKKANDFKFNIKKFSRRKYKAEVNDLISFYDKKFFQKKIFKGNPSTQPTFIVGLPRAGKTLMEKSLASHNDVSSAGELDDIRILTNKMQKELDTYIPFPDCIEVLDDKTALKLTNEYLDRLSRDSKAKYITDTMPSNFQRVGLIHKLFPNAKIIHCHRKMEDHCLYLYFAYFVNKYYWTYDFERIVFFYKEYERLMNHWAKMLPNHMITIEYEDQVKNTEETMRKVCKFINLPWSDDIMNFDGIFDSNIKYSGENKIYDLEIDMHKNYWNHIKKYFD